MPRCQPVFCFVRCLGVSTSFYFDLLLVVEIFYFKQHFLMFLFRVCFYSVVYLITRKVNPDYLNMTLINRKLMETNGLTMPTFFLFVTILAAIMLLCLSSIKPQR